MRFQLLTLVLMATFFYLSASQGSYEDCCLSYFRVKHPKNIQKYILSYRVQNTGGGCNLPAIVLTLNRVTICVNPNETWVKNYINSLKMKKNKKERTRRCLGHSASCRRRRKH
ncbi:C-C motif chemokine 25b [Heptranchias perlo]|uniref:C-C motif chemokine 25b n=1 Tax=Heptranchias perlo TaxID=212740 RepID=UPI00355A6E95